MIDTSTREPYNLAVTDLPRPDLDGCGRVSQAQEW